MPALTLDQQIEIVAMMDRGERPCPGVSGPVCLNPAEPGDRYCDGCRAEFDAQPDDRGW